MELGKAVTWTTGPLQNHREKIEKYCKRFLVYKTGGGNQKIYVSGSELVALLLSGGTCIIVKYRSFTLAGRITANAMVHAISQTNRLTCRL